MRFAPCEVSPRNSLVIYCGDEYATTRLERKWVRQEIPNQDYVAEILSCAEQLPLRRDMVTLLTYVRDSKVVGTQSTGNPPRKVIREVAAPFVEPPTLDVTIGKRIYRLRTETEVWPVYYLISWPKWAI